MTKKILLPKMKCFMFIVIISLSLQDTRADDGQLLKEGFKEFFDTRVLPNYLKDFAKNHQIDFSFFEYASISNISQEESCNACDDVVNTVISLKKADTPDIILKSMVTEICTTFKFEDERICNGLVGPMMDVLLYIFGNGTNVTGPKMCSLLLGPTCHDQFEFFNWTIEIPPKPSVIAKKTSFGNEIIRILHLTDMHVDPRYTPGSRADCGEALCCQDDQGKAENPEDACGIWGDYRNADTSMKLLDETLRHAKTQGIDYVYSTGDIIPHRVWSTSRESNAELERKIMELVRDSFNVPTLFVLGNHEPHPVNMYAPTSVNQTNLSTKWLYETLKAEELEQFPDENLESINQGGFYTVVLRPGLRVIVLNNIVCYLENYWLALEDYDPYGQLAWLIDVLLQAETNGEYVHILYHMPTGSESCLGTWTREYNKIISRFSDTISGQFNGHTHYDEFFLYYNQSNSTDVIQVAFNGASLATFIGNNPSYKIYEVGTQNFRVQNFEEWTFNLTDANLNTEKETVDWYKLYSFKEMYGLYDMEPKTIGKMVDDLAKNRTLLEAYNKIKFRMGSEAERICDDNCHKRNLCSIVTSELSDTFHCERIKKLYEESSMNV